MKQYAKRIMVLLMVLAMVWMPADVRRAPAAAYAQETAEAAAETSGQETAASAGEAEPAPAQAEEPAAEQPANARDTAVEDEQETAAPAADETQPAGDVAPVTADQETETELAQIDGEDETAEDETETETETGNENGDDPQAGSIPPAGSPIPDPTQGENEAGENEESGENDEAGENDEPGQSEEPGTDENPVEKIKITAVELSSSSSVYNGEEVDFANLTVTVKAGDDTVPEGNYTVTRPDNAADAGEYAFMVTAEGDTYEGTAEAKYTIEQCSIENAEFTVTPASDIYTGEDIGLTFELKVGDTVLEMGEDKDYTVSVTKVKDAGKTTVTATLIGNYTGTVQGEVTITPLSIEGDEFTVQQEELRYTGQAQDISGKIKLLWNNQALTLGTNFLVAAPAPDEVVNAGGYEVTVVGQGNFTGTKEFDVTVFPYEVKDENASIQGVDMNYWYSDEEYISKIKPEIHIDSKEGETLKPVSGTDYDIQFLFGGQPTNSVRAKGKYQCRAAFKGTNYTGTIEFSFKVCYFLDNTTCTWKGHGENAQHFYYTGKKFTPAKVRGMLNIPSVLIYGADKNTAGADYYIVVDGDPIDVTKNTLGWDHGFEVRVIAIAGGKLDGNIGGNELKKWFVIDPLPITFEMQPAYIYYGQDATRVKPGEPGAGFTSEAVVDGQTGKLKAKARSTVSSIPLPMKKDEADVTFTFTGIRMEEKKYPSNTTEAFDFSRSGFSVSGDKAKNYSLVSPEKANLTVEEYHRPADADPQTPLVQFDGNKGWPNGEFKKDDARFSGWFRGTDAITVKSSNSDFQIALAGEGEAYDASFSGEQSHSLNNDDGKGLTETVNLYVRNNKSDDPAYGAVDIDETVTVSYDTAYKAEVTTDSETITTRDDKITFKNDGEEDAYVFVSYEASMFENPMPGTPSRDQMTKVEKGGSASISLYIHNGAEAKENNKFEQEGVSQLNFLPAGTEVTLHVLDAAQNKGEGKSWTVIKKEIRGLTLSAGSARQNSADDFVMPRENPSFTITGEPNEVIKIEHVLGDDVVPSYACLGSDGKAVLSFGASGPAKVTATDHDERVLTKDDQWIFDGDNVHNRQTIKVSYPDTDNIQVNDPEEPEASLNFIYAHAVLQLRIDPNLKNRDQVMTLILPEDGTITEIAVNEQSVLGEQTEAKFKTPTEVKLAWNGMPPRLMSAAGCGVRIVYKDLADNVSEAVFPVTRSTVQQEISMSIEPEANDRSMLNGSVRKLRVFGKAAEYETVTLSIPGVFSAEAVTSGEGNYDDNGSASGVWSVTLDMSSVPQEKELTMTAAYRDVNGNGDNVKFIYDTVCDPSFITSPVYDSAKLVSGIVERGSMVTVHAGAEKIRAQVDGFGVFIVPLPLIFEGEIVRVDVIDPAGNRDEMVVPVTASAAMHRVKAYALGRVCVSGKNHNENPGWFMALKLTPEKLLAGVTMPLTGGNAFVVGDVTVKMNEQGYLSFNYTLKDGTEVRDAVCYVADKLDKQGFVNHSLQALRAGEEIAVNPQAKELWLSVEFDVDVPSDNLSDSFQLQDYMESDVRTLYRKVQRTAAP